MTVTRAEVDGTSNEGRRDPRLGRDIIPEWLHEHVEREEVDLHDGEKGGELKGKLGQRFEFQDGSDLLQNPRGGATT